MTHTELAKRGYVVSCRLVRLLEYINKSPYESTADYIDAVGRYTRSDLQRLWEDGQVVRYKCPEIANEFGIGHVSAWFWSTIEGEARENQLDQEASTQAARQ